MKGVILAGGMGSRLLPLTKVTNKHLLPVWDKPMIYYPIESLVTAGITDICLIVGGHYAGEFMRLIGNGEEFGITNLHYAYQKDEGGIAAALRLAKGFVGNDAMVVILGDNIFEKPISKFVEAFKKQLGYSESAAHILLSKVHDPRRFGCPHIIDGQVIEIIEKPANPPSQYAVTGIYGYDNHVFNVIEILKPSKRGELEITDVNNHYINCSKMQHSYIDGWWTDAGTFESLYDATTLVKAKHHDP